MGSGDWGQDYGGAGIGEEEEEVQEDEIKVAGLDWWKD